MDGIKLVNQASKPPGKCLVSLDTEGPFVDTGMYAMHHNPYLYLSVRWIKEVAKNLLGMVPAEQVEARLAEFEAQIAEQAEKLALLEHFAKAAADYEEARNTLVAPEHLTAPPDRYGEDEAEDEAKIAAAPDAATVEADAEALAAITGGGD